MKFLAIIAALLGIVTLVMAFVVILTQSYIMGVTGAGYLRVSSVFLLLAIVIMVFDKCYLSSGRY